MAKRQHRSHDQRAAKKQGQRDTGDGEQDSHGHMAVKKVMPESHGQQAAQKQRPKGSHGKMAVKKRESHGVKAAKKSC